MRTQAFSIYNLEAVANYTAGLDLDTVTPTGDTVRLSTDLAPFTNLGAGQACQYFSATLNTSVAGTWQTVVTLAVSDEDVPGATVGTALTLTLKAVVALSVIVAADFDSDGDVDADDFAIFAGCLNGAVKPPGHTGCGPADLDGDGDVDMADFAIFQRCLSGPGTAPDPNCAG